jgi:nicotinate-nucleotide pyrophosphorylase (carboxylating)
MSDFLSFKPADVTAPGLQDLSAGAAHDVAIALAEDVAQGDLTANLIDPATQAHARIVAREAAVVCGRPWVEAAFAAVDAAIELRWLVQEGAVCAADQVVLEMRGPARSLLTAERTALNFLQLLSAVATKTQTYCQAVAGSKAAIVDTRKTLPGLRMAQKYAVAVGGGVNHRIGLFDAILIKENHIAAAGGVYQALSQAHAVAQGPGGHALKFVQIEVETLAQLHQALDAGANMILLDNMSLDTLRQAVDINAGRAVLEVSGGVTFERLAALAATGVDRISIGGLTKDVVAVDYSMRFQAV